MTSAKESRPRRSWLLGMILDEGKFAKGVQSCADVITLDLEDAVVPARKEEARARLLEILGRGREAVGGRELWVRINNITTPWGLSDLDAVAGLDIDGIIYPCVRGAEEVWTVRRTMLERGSRADLKLILETPQAFMNLNDIVRVPGVTSLTHGAGDLSMETGISVRDRASFAVTATMTVLAARAYGASVTEGIHLEDWRNEAAVRDYVAHAKLQGFDGAHSFYLPNMKIINDVFTPSADEIAQARRTVDAFEDAQKSGRPAVVLEGRVILVHQYERARQLLGAA